ncbi:hypothetical protein GUJ93_ZPchr0012g19357 [Zizania palustris]|uniref:Uncharacterized protein n=1 Tax=Zizania palustris TaxID=103762 RepID=A0A8J5WSS3_ZIZPA|nr:hypothetical protein GUJ93_ZPchr0012g19357 [Zizania palustris]
MRAVSVSLGDATAWVSTSGATLGELYSPSRRVPESGVPSRASCPTIGVGGHLSVRDQHELRKYGLSIDNTSTPKIVNANGELSSTGPPWGGPLWAIPRWRRREFGIVVSWKIRLVQVHDGDGVHPRKDGHQGRVDIVTNAWQGREPSPPKRVTIRVICRGRKPRSSPCTRVVRRLLPTIAACSGELGMRALTAGDELAAVGGRSSQLLEPQHAGGGAPQPEKRTACRRSKVKSDYVERAIPNALEEHLPVVHHERRGMAILERRAGFAVASAAAARTPHPPTEWHAVHVQLHRVLVRRQHGCGGRTSDPRPVRVNGTYVSKNPRAAYVNYRDLDLGENAVAANDVSSFDSGKVWGRRWVLLACRSATVLGIASHVDRISTVVAA